MITRRKFLQRSSLLATTVATAKSGLLNAIAQAHAVPTMAPALDVSTLAQFVDRLTIPAVAQRQGARPSPADPRQSIPFYRIQAQPIVSKIHRDLRAPLGSGASVPLFLVPHSRRAPLNLC